ncbi:glycosyltransferase family 2 protein [Hyphomonas beringensis]|nr:glycosyltransferase family 2 protein [Hyphomonas beringensis]
MSNAPSSTPTISVIMANYNCEAYLKGAIRSVLNQTLANIELILVDDGSSDGSVALAEEIAQQDPRLRVFSGTRFGGPAPVRNHALDQARGEWIAIVDSDDLIAPQRLEHMLEAAISTKADIMIDDLAIFQNEGEPDITTMLDGDLKDRPGRIMESEYIKANMMYGRGSQLGYAKPLIRRSSLDTNNIRYNESMRIGEDYDLIVRLLSAGARMMSLPEAMYFYRKHNRSISHRLDANSLDALRAAAEAAMCQPTPHAEVTAAHAARLKSIRRAIVFDGVIEALKQKNIVRTLMLFRQDPTVLPLLRLPLLGKLQKVTGNPFARSDEDLTAELQQLRQQCEA